MKRLDCLDGLRGVLALYVLLSHMAPFAVLPPTLLSLLSHGEAAVDLFFVLSGLVIAASVEHFEYRAGPFLLARAARILPVFLPVFGVAVLVQPLAVDFAAMPWIGPDSTARHIWADGWPSDWAAEIALHLTMLHGLVPHAILPHVWVSFLGSAWSLSTEWQFYALVALVGPALGRGQPGLWRMTVLLSAIAVLGATWHAVGPAGWQFSRAFLPNKALYFALGVASIALLRNPAAWPRFIAVLTVATALCFARENMFKALIPPLWAVCLMAQMMRARSGGGWPALRQVGAFLESRPARWLGGVSYSLYLVNEPIQKSLGVALAAVVAGDARLFTALWVPGAVLLPLGVAWWLRVAIEVPAMQSGRALARAMLDHGKMLVFAPVSGFDLVSSAGPATMGAVPSTAHRADHASTQAVFEPVE